MRGRKRTKPKAGADAAPNGHEPDGYFQNYSEHSRTLRTWLVAYGIGAPVLILNSSSLLKLVQQSGTSNWIAGLFLGGVCGQILLAFVNKWCAYHVYLAEVNEAFRNTRTHKVSTQVNQWWGLDLVLDFASIALMAVATGMLLVILLGGNAKPQEAVASAVRLPTYPPAPLSPASKAHAATRTTSPASNAFADQHMLDAPGWVLGTLCRIDRPVVPSPMVTAAFQHGWILFRPNVDPGSWGASAARILGPSV